MMTEKYQTMKVNTISLDKLDKKYIVCFVYIVSSDDRKVPNYGSQYYKLCLQLV